MEAPQFLGYIEKVSRSTDAASLKNNVGKIVEILLTAEHELKLNITSQPHVKSYFGEQVFRDLDYTLGRALGGLQSTERITQRNFGILIGALLEKFHTNVNLSKVLDNVHFKLNKKQAFSKTEIKSFIAGRQIFYAQFIELTDNKDLLERIVQHLLADLEQEPMFVESTVLSLVNIMERHNNQKWIFNTIEAVVRNLLKDPLPHILTILIHMQSHYQAKNIRYQWDKYLQDKILNKDNLMQYVTMQLSIFPRKSLFYSAVIKYMLQVNHYTHSQFQNEESNKEVMKEFFLHFVAVARKQEEEEVPHHQRIAYALMKFLHHYYKSTVDTIDTLLNKQLVEIWYRSIGSANKHIKKAAFAVEKSICKQFTGSPINFMTYIRSIYGYRLNPKSKLAVDAYSKFSIKEVGTFFKTLKKLAANSTDPQQKIYYLNEIYVLFDIAYPLVVENQLQQVLWYLFEESLPDKVEYFYSHLTEEVQQQNDLSETKQKFQDQSLSFFYSLVHRLFTKEYSQYIDPTLKFVQGQIKVQQQISSGIHEKLSQLVEGDQRTSLTTLLYVIEFFCLSNQEEGNQILEEFDHVVSDVSKILSAKEPPLRKKVKKQSPDSNKWIKVLVELMIQLLTKSTAYIRDSVNQCFKSFVGYMDQECLTLITDVLIRDTAEFVEDMDERELLEVGGLIEEESVNEETQQ